MLLNFPYLPRIVLHGSMWSSIAVKPGCSCHLLRTSTTTTMCNCSTGQCYPWIQKPNWSCQCHKRWRTLNFYAMYWTCHSAPLWLFSMIQDLNASKISNRKAKISIFFMMYSEYLIGVQCIYLLKYSVDKVDPCECLSNFLVEVPLEVYSSN